jgi:predicted nucleotidyltransferase
MKYSEPRFTKDFDLWVSNSPVNAEKLFQALAHFGAPLKDDGITPETFSQADIVYQLGVAPVRIDILTHVTGVRFEDAWPSRVKGAIFGVPVHFISLDDLIANKQATGRISDAEQLKHLQKTLGRI